MSDRTFVDTNVFVYAVDDAEPAKREVARTVLASGQYGELVLSTQILSEFYVTVTRRFAARVSVEEVVQGLDRLCQYRVVSVDTTLIKSAIQTSRSARISYWDSLVVAAAARAGCERLLTEDLNEGQTIGSVCIENPFRDAA